MSFESGVCDGIFIYNNSITNQREGIVINTWISNFTVIRNIITNHQYGGIYFQAGTRYFDSNVIRDNIISYNGARTVDGRESSAGPLLQPNIIPINQYSVICGVGLTFIRLYLIRTGLTTYTVYFISEDNGKVARNFPQGIVTFKIGGKSYPVQLVEGSASVTVNLLDISSDISADYYGLGAVLNWNSEMTTFIPDLEDIYDFTDWTGIPLFTPEEDSNDNGSGNGTGIGNNNGNGNGQGTGTGEGLGGKIVGEGFNYGGLSQSTLNNGQSQAKSFQGKSTNNFIPNSNPSDPGVDSNQEPQVSSGGGSSGGGSGENPVEVTIKDAVDSIVKTSNIWAPIIVIIVVLLMIFGYFRQRKTNSQ